jgi:hypothetical protein
VRVVDINCAGTGNHLQYAVHVFDDVVIPEPDDAPTVDLKPNRAPAVCIVLRGMLSTIELDNEAVIGADEIGNEWTERYLATEFNAAEPAIAQARP